jgi:hypothetical protein
MRCLPTPLLRRDWPLILRYELLACAQAAVRGRWTTISGRIAAWRDRPALLSQRREIQRRCAVPLAELDRWVLPARGPAQVWRQASALAQVLSDRAETKQP